MPPMPELSAKHTIKDSVFTTLFGEPKYALQLYQTIHPEDTCVAEADCSTITLENILLKGQMYNDLGLLVRSRLIFLVEAQSTFSVNIVIRLLLYVAKTYQEYVEDRKLNLYSGTAVTVPRPELYMVYTGKKRDVPELLRLSDLYEGPGSIEVEVKVLRGGGTRSILDQYIRFCEIWDEVRVVQGSGVDAVDLLLRRCLSEQILTEFLAKHKKEVVDMMVTLFSQEKATEIHEYNLVKDAEDRGRKEGRKEGRDEGIAALVMAMRQLSQSRETVIKILMQQFSLPQSAAEDAVSQYWK